MKLNQRHRNGLFVALLVVLPMSAGVHAQEKPHYTHANTRFDVNFPGGTVADYIRVIRESSAEGAANIVVMPRAKALAMPPVKLVAVTVEAAMQILEGPYTTDGGLAAEIEVRTFAIGDSADLVMKVLAHVESRHVRSAVWSVEEALVYGQKAGELLEAVEAARSLFPTKAEISFHPPTGLLIARGTDEQLDLVREVLEQLIEGAERRQQEVSSIRERMGDLEGDRFRVQAEMNVSSKEVAAVSVRLNRVLKGMEDGLYTPENLAQEEIQVARAEASLMVQQHELLRIDTQLKNLRDALRRYKIEKE